VYNNDAYACVSISPLVNNDVTCTEPENEAEAGDEVACLANGELAQNLDFFAWAETDGNNIFEGTLGGEINLFSNVVGLASDVLGGKTYTLADPTTGPVLPGGSTRYIGLAWCAGDLQVNTTTGAMVCDGSTMGNNAQTDSMTADITFRVEQARNNAQFSCLVNE
jgi:hypothetical protein